MVQFRSHGLVLIKLEIYTNIYEVISILWDLTFSRQPQTRHEGRVWMVIHLLAHFRFGLLLTTAIYYSERWKGTWLKLSGPLATSRIVLHETNAPCHDNRVKESDARLLSGMSSGVTKVSQFINQIHVVYWNVFLSFSHLLSMKRHHPLGTNLELTML